MKLPARMIRSPALMARLARRRLLVRVRPLALAAAVALGATGPVVQAQTVITPLTGAGQTATVVTSQGNQTVVNTQSLRDGNAFSTYSAFQVGQGDTVKLAVPQGANWWVNIVRDSRVRVDGRLESRLTDGRIGGNILFVDSHGFAVGPTGQVDVGRLTFAAPSTTFVDALLAGGGVLSGAAVAGLLTGQFERSANGAVDIQGRVMAQDGVNLMAGAGGGAARAVSITGQVVVQGRAAGSAVNLGDLKTLAPLQDLDGVIDITTPGSIRLDGVLISDSALWTRAGAIRVVAGTDIAVGANTRISASGAVGTGQAGGQIALFAHRDIANEPGAVLRAHGDGAGAGGQIEYSSVKKLALHNMTLDAGSDTGKGGLVYLDPEDATITQEAGNLTNGADFVVEASNSITVSSGTIVNTRQVAAGDSTNDNVASSGNSGNISLTAPHIAVESDSVLDASVQNRSGSTYTAGDVTLTAKHSSSGETLVTLADANASIDVAGKLKGRDITLSATIESSAQFGGISGTIQQKVIDLALEGLGSPLALSLAYVEAKGDANVRISSGAVLDASRDLSITAMADRSAGAETKTEGASFANLSAGFARVSGTTSIDVEGDTLLRAGRNIDMVAASKTTIAMSSAAAGETDEATGAANVASVVFAGSQSDVTTSVHIAAGAVLVSGGDTTLQAFHGAQYETSAEAKVYGGGTVGMVGALSLQKSTTTVTVDGRITAGGDVKLMAMNASAKNSISAEAVNASEDEEADKPELPESLELSDDEAKEKLFSGFMDMAAELGRGPDKASGGDASPPALRMAGAMTWSQSDHTTRASLGADAVVNAAGNVVIDAQTLVGQLKSSTASEATSETDGEDASKIALSAAFNFGSHSYTTEALVGAGAVINGAHVAVHAATDIPEFYSAGLPLEWDSITSAYENIMGGTDFLTDGFNSNVGASGAAADLAVAGAVSLSFIKNKTVAWVDTGAHITATAVDNAPWSYGVREVAFDSDIESMATGPAPYRLDKDLGVLGDFVSETRVAPQGNDLEAINFTREFGGSVVVRVENHVQTLHMAGGSGPEAGGDGGSVGGTFSLVNRDNTAIAGIADKAVIDTRRLDVAAETTDWLLTVSPTSGGGEGVAANGIVSYNQVKEVTHASISREAKVTAQAVNVDAQLSLGAIAITGAVTQSENSGVGIGIAMNEIQGGTQAYVGDNNADDGRTTNGSAAAGFIATGALGVRAISDGMVIAVGVAGAKAGSKAAKPDLAEKADSASTASQSIAGDGGTAALGDIGGDLQGQGAAGSGGEGESEGESKPPKFSVAGAGAVVTNFTDIDTLAQIDGAVVHGIASGTTAVNVRALSDLMQVSVAGGGALAMANNSSTTFSSAIAGAVAIQSSDDDTTARIGGSSITALADRADALTVQALKTGERTAVATGISVNMSSGSTSDLSIVGSASITHVSDDTLASIENSTVTGNAANPTALDAVVLAYDRSRIGAGGGSLSFSKGKGSAGIGAAISVVDMDGSTSAFVNGGAITKVHDLTVAAMSSQKVVGIAAVAGIQTASDSKGQLLGSFVFNDIRNTVAAGVKGGALVNLSGDLDLKAGGALSDSALNDMMGSVRTSYVTDYEMSSNNSGYTSDFTSAVGGESIVGVAGTLSVTLGNNANSMGISYAQNNIQTRYSAELAANVTASGDVRVDAVSQADIIGISAGLGVTKGKFSGMGSASVNLIGQQTDAQVNGGSVTAASLAVGSGTEGNLFGLAGNLSFAVGSGSGTAAGAAIAYNQTGTRTYTDGGPSMTTAGAGNAASINNYAVINTGGGNVTVAAHNTSDTMALAASGAAATGNMAFAGAAAWNEIGDVTDAEIRNATVHATTVTVQAGEGEGAQSARIRSLVGGLSASKGYSAALAFGFNTIESERSAQILSSGITASHALSVLADAQGSIETLSVAMAGGKDYAIAGSSSVNWLNGSTTALIDDSTIAGSASTLTVHATQSGSIDSLAGAVSVGLTGGAIGAAVAVNMMGAGADDFSVSAGLTNTTLTTAAAVLVEAKLTGAIGSIAAAGGASAGTAINGSVTRNVIDGDVTATVDKVQQQVTGSTFTVSAAQTSSISSLAGVIGGAGSNAIGGAIAVNDISSNVDARLADSTLNISGAVKVQADMAGTIRSVAAAGGGAGSVAVNGSNTTNSLTSTVQAEVTGLTQISTSTSFDVTARDRSTIQSLAGSVSGGGTAGAGAAIALNFLGRTASDADAQKLVKASVVSSKLSVSGAVNVLASSESSIESMGVAVAGGGTFAITGSNTTNILEDTVTANWSGSTLDGSNSGSLTLKASDDASIASLAGNFSGGGTAAVGAAAAVNKVATQVGATLSGTGIGKVATGDVNVRAESDANIDTIAVGMSASGTVGVQGSVAVSMISSTTSALVNNGAVIEAWDSVAVTADSNDRIKALAGAAALGAGGIGVAGGVLVNMITSSTTAGISGAATRVSGLANGDGVLVNTSVLASAPDLMNITQVTDAALSTSVLGTGMRHGVAVQATSIEQIAALTSV
ncbi:MAG: hypothetical protein JWP77_15, partial [Polaromonas sp.]|nr:hypothetical protein [Polaromonas sp.]